MRDLFYHWVYFQNILNESHLITGCCLVVSTFLIHHLIFKSNLFNVWSHMELRHNFNIIKNTTKAPKTLVFHEITKLRENTAACFEDIPLLGRYNSYYYSMFRYSVIWAFKFLLLPAIMCWAPFNSSQWEMKKPCGTKVNSHWATSWDLILYKQQTFMDLQAAAALISS